MTYAELKADLLALIGRAPASICYKLATADINAALRVRDMEATTTLTGAASIALPSDFLGLVDVYLDTDPRRPLRPTTAQAINRSHEASGIPTQYALVDGAMLLNPSPDGSYDVVLRYYASLANLSADSDTNAIMDKYPGVYVYGVLSHHASLIRDVEAASIYKAEFMKSVKLAQASDTSDRYSGAPLVPTVRVAP